MLSIPILMPAQVGAVVTRIGEKYREAALILVAKAYSTIKIADLAVYLGQVIENRICPLLFTIISVTRVSDVSNGGRLYLIN